MGAGVYAHQFPNVWCPVPIGFTATYLEDGGQKLSRPGFLTRLFAPGSRIAGGGIWFGTPHSDEPFVVGEGIETTLSAMIIFGAGAGVATLAANFLPVVRLPDPAQNILLAADHDDEKSRNIGFRKAAYAAALWRKVALKRPHDPGVDFNDILKFRRGIAP
jgi:phage/plasmid primase-like uncharacterized protein